MKAYTDLAQHYDRLTEDVPYPAWANYLQRHFRRCKGGVRTIAELACGTGSLACLLAQRAETVVRVFCGIPTVLKGEEIGRASCRERV